MDDSEISGPLEEQFVAAIAEHAPQYDVVIATDFGHGLITAAGRARGPADRKQIPRCEYPKQQRQSRL
jgi:hypothetical protein